MTSASTHWQSHWICGVCFVWFLLWCNESVVVNGFDHILKLDFGRPGPTVIDNWLPRSFPAVHCRHKHVNKKVKKKIYFCVWKQHNTSHYTYKISILTFNTAASQTQSPYISLRRWFTTKLISRQVSERNINPSNIYKVELHWAIDHKKSTSWWRRVSVIPKCKLRFSYWRVVWGVDPVVG